MMRRRLVLIVLAMVFLSAACAGRGAGNSSASEAADAAIGEQASEGAGEQGSEESATRHPPPGTPSPQPSPTGRGSATPLPTRVGSDYVLLLPREDAMPAGWAISPRMPAS